MQYAMVLSLGLASASILACAQGSPIAGDMRTALTRAGPAAVVAGNMAVFVFPPDSIEHFAPTAQDSLRGNAGVDFLWEVTWDVPYDRLGVDPHGVQSTGPTLECESPGPACLLAVVDRSSGAHSLFCLDCSSPATLARPDTSVRASLVNGQVVISVRGPAALRRILPGDVPDSVTFFWRGPGEWRGEVAVPVDSVP